jgi:hypothetical protein
LLNNEAALRKRYTQLVLKINHRFKQLQGHWAHKTQKPVTLEIRARLITEIKNHHEELKKVRIALKMKPKRTDRAYEIRQLGLEKEFDLKEWP